MIKNIYKMEKKLVNAHKGKGMIKFCRVFEKKDFKTNINFIDYAILSPGQSVGIHTHKNNEEIYLILKGRGSMILGNKRSKVQKGDVVINPVKGKHGLLNDSKQDIHLYVFEVII